jgi:hypothetical protein
VAAGDSVDSVVVLGTGDVHMMLRMMYSQVFVRRDTSRVVSVRCIAVLLRAAADRCLMVGSQRACMWVLV